MATSSPEMTVPPSATRLHARPVLSLVIFGLTLVVVAAVVFRTQHLAIYGMVLLPILAAKLGLSLLPQKAGANNQLLVGVVVTVYNEDAELVRQCLDSLHRQTRPPHRIVVVDDASSDPGARRVAEQDPRVTLIVHETNQGKRAAMATGFREMEGTVDVYACVDSDARLEPRALDEGMAPFSNPAVTAATGVVIPSNHGANLLTRLIDVRYVNAFVVERAAYSALNSVLCVCGVLAFYRADMVHRHLDRFLGQRFLGSPAIVGDDRHMTNLALLDGHVVLARQAIAHTAVPQNVSHYLRQQSRWGRSFFRESLWALRHHHWRRPAWWLTVVELGQWVGFTTMLGYVLVVHPLLTGRIPIVEYIAFVSIMAVARSARYFDLVREDQSVASRILTFLTTPVFGVFNLFVMIPMRMWSLLTLRRSHWGTRSVIEITAEQAPTPRLTATASTAARTRAVEPRTSDVLGATGPRIHAGTAAIRG